MIRPENARDRNRSRSALLPVVLLLALQLVGARVVLAEPPEAIRKKAAQPRLLSLEDVLYSVERSYPRLLAAELERVRAESVLLEARGAFDTRFGVSGEARPTEYYDRYTADVAIEQQTRLWGSRVYGGYRIGRGDFPSYYGGDKTNETGEVRAGIEIPLLQGGAIDDQRTGLRRGEIGLELADPVIELQRLAIVRDASEAYWNWLANGLSVDIERRLLAVAEARTEQLEGRARNGAIPRVLLLDNQRLVLERKIRLRGAQQDFMDASLDLSLFLRDETGAIQFPGLERLPRQFPEEDPLDPERVAKDIDRARSGHPRLREFELRRKDAEAKLALARNKVLPEANLRIEGSRDVGPSSAGIDSSGGFSTNPKDDTAVAAIFDLEFPVLQRGARGRAAAERAALARIELEALFAQDVIETEIRQASTRLETAFDQTRLARENFDLALELQRAEERKFSLGSSNLIDVNIREVQATQAARQLVSAQAAYFRSLARYVAAVAAPPNLE